MKMQITNAEASNLFQMLSNLKIKGGDKFVYAIAKNRAILKGVVEAIQQEANSFAEGSERFKEYQKRNDELIRTFSTSPDGKPSVKDTGDGNTLQRVVPKEKLGDFAAARDALEAEFKDVTLAAQLHQAEFQKYLRKEIEVDLRVLKMKDVPDEAKDTQYMNLLFIFIEEDGDKAEVVPLKEVKNNEQPPRV
jgi:hypothetical protein